MCKNMIVTNVMDVTPHTIHPKCIYVVNKIVEEAGVAFT